MALVNCYIIKNLILKRKGKDKMNHHTFFKTLQHGLIAVTEEDFTRSTPRFQIYQATRRRLFRAAPGSGATAKRRSHPRQHLIGRNSLSTNLSQSRASMAATSGGEKIHDEHASKNGATTDGDAQ